ncbi:MAG: hypothetical protein ACRDJ3_03235 [Solirubrobacteraceae bacterium]
MAYVVVLAVVGVLLFVNLFFRLTRFWLRQPKRIRWIWRNSRPRQLWSVDRTLFGGVVWGFAKGLEWYAARELRVQPFEGDEKTDAAAVSSALSSAMAHIGSSHRSGVDVVSAPISAGTAMEAIADAVKGAPSGGEFAAGLLRLFGWLIARGELQLSGHVLTSRLRGPGLALTVATSGGRVLEREMIWACDFEPAVGVGEVFDDGDDTDRLLRVATAGAVWTYFTIFEEVWCMREDELKDRFQTTSWRSYALMQVGIDGHERRRPEVTRALYARAVDADPSNMVAQFNLASAELKDEQLEHVRTAGSSRLERVHESFHSEHREETEGATELEHERWLLQCDPLHHQVAYKQGAAKLNHDVAVERSLEKSSGGRARMPAMVSAFLLPQPRVDGDAAGWMRPAGLTLTFADLNELSTDLRRLEQTLVVLCEEDEKRWVAAGAKPWMDLKRVLSAIEGPMLVMWAMVALRVGRAVWVPWSSEALRESAPLLLSDPGAVDSAVSSRKWLIERLRGGRLTPGEAVGFAGCAEVSRTSRTHFNLACWYADVDRLSESLCELELSLEGGGVLAGRWLCDRQLRRVRERFPKQSKKLRLRYLSLPLAVEQNGRVGDGLAVVEAAGQAAVSGDRDE